METQSILVLTLSIVTGEILGEALKIEEQLNNFGEGSWSSVLPGDGNNDSIGSDYEGTDLEVGGNPALNSKLCGER